MTRKLPPYDDSVFADFFQNERDFMKGMRPRIPGACALRGACERAGNSRRRIRACPRVGVGPALPARDGQMESVPGEGTATVHGTRARITFPNSGRW